MDLEAHLSIHSILIQMKIQGGYLSQGSAEKESQ